MSRQQTKGRVHWLGAGLSSVPGIRRLAQVALSLHLWNRTLEKAQQALADLDSEASVHAFDMEELAAQLKRGDIVVSMLPGDWHLRIAGLCLEKNAHFVSSSYISEEMRALDKTAKQKDLCLVNEVGLDPGLDHLMAHALVAQYQAAAEYSAKNQLYFRSYCGGFPSQANEFRYKFSWSPLGVLRALKTPSRSIQNGEVIDVARPWQAISMYQAKLPEGRTESFEAYPNRDAVPFMQDYGFQPEWSVQEFVRGTLRLDGWAKAWQDIFSKIDNLDNTGGQAVLEEMSAELWQRYAYAEGEADRVVLCVELEAREGEQPAWHRSYSIDARGNDQGSAMARLVSLTVSLAVDSLAEGKIEAGVSAAPNDTQLIQQWFSTLENLGERIELIISE